MNVRFGEDNKKAISTYVGTRTITQIRSHLQKFKLRLVSDLLSSSSYLLNLMDRRRNQHVQPYTEREGIITLISLSSTKAEELLLLLLRILH